MIPTFMFLELVLGMYFNSIIDKTSYLVPHKSMAESPPVKNYPSSG